MILLIGLNTSREVAFAPWMAAFTETVERRIPAMVATDLAIYGIVRCITAVSILFVPQVVTTVSALVEKGPFASQLGVPYEAELGTAAKIDAATRAALAEDPAAATAMLSQGPVCPAGPRGSAREPRDQPRRTGRACPW